MACPPNSRLDCGCVGRHAPCPLALPLPLPCSLAHALALALSLPLSLSLPLPLVLASCGHLSGRLERALLLARPSGVQPARLAVQAAGCLAARLACADSRWAWATSWTSSETGHATRFFWPRPWPSPRPSQRQLPICS